MGFCCIIISVSVLKMFWHRLSYRSRYFGIVTSLPVNVTHWAINAAFNHPCTPLIKSLLPQRTRCSWAELLWETRSWAVKLLIYLLIYIDPGLQSLTSGSSGKYWRFWMQAVWNTLPFMDWLWWRRSAEERALSGAAASLPSKGSRFGWVVGLWAFFWDISEFKPSNCVTNPPSLAENVVGRKNL